MMIGKIWRVAGTGLAIVGTWAFLLAFATILMELSWAIWSAAAPHRYDVAIRTVFDAWLLVIWIGIVPAFVLRRRHVRNVAAYLVAGIGSALLAPYTLLMAMRFGIPMAFCCLPNPTLPDLLLAAFTDGRHTFDGFLESNGYSPIAVFAAPGLFWGLIAWRLLRPKQLETDH